MTTSAFLADADTRDLVSAWHTYRATVTPHDPAWLYLGLTADAVIRLGWFLHFTDRIPDLERVARGLAPGIDQMTLYDAACDADRFFAWAVEHYGDILEPLGITLSETARHGLTEMLSACQSNVSREDARGIGEHVTALA